MFSMQGSLLSSQYLDANKTYLSFSHNPNAFYIGFAYELCFTQDNASYYVNQLREKIEFVLQNCLPGKASFVMHDFNFTYRWQQFIYKLLLQELNLPENLRLNAEQQQLIERQIAAHGHEHMATFLTKNILCLIFQVNIKESSVSNGQSSRYNPAELDVTKSNTLHVYFQGSNLKIVTCLSELHSAYLFLLEVLAENLTGKGYRQDPYNNQLRYCLRMILQKFQELLNSLDKITANLLLKFLSVNRYNLTGPQEALLNYYLNDLLARLETLRQESLELLGKDMVDMLLQVKVRSLPFRRFFRSNATELVNQLASPSRTFEFAKHLVIDNLDVLFVRFAQPVERLIDNYNFDGIYTSLIIYATEILAVKLCRDSMLKNILLHNFKVCLDLLPEGPGDLAPSQTLLDYQQQAINLVYYSRIKAIVQLAMKDASKACQLTPEAYLNKMVFFGPLDGTAKMLLSLILGMVIYEYTVTGTYVEHRVPFGFTYKVQKIVLVQDPNFIKNASYVTPVKLHILYDAQYYQDFVARNIPSPEQNPRRNVYQHERDKTPFVAMFHPRLDYQINSKFVINCPASPQSYLLPIFLDLLQQGYFKGRTLQDLPWLRARVVDFFIINSNNAYKAQFEELLPLDEQGEKEAESPQEQEFLLKQNLYQVDKILPESLLQTVADFFNINIMVHYFDNKPSVSFKPQLIEPYTAWWQFFNQSCIELHATQTHYNLLTSDKNWSIAQELVNSIPQLPSNPAVEQMHDASEQPKAKKVLFSGNLVSYEVPKSPSSPSSEQQTYSAQQHKQILECLMLS